MNDTLAKTEKRTAYILTLPAVFLVFAIVLFPIFANIWISFKEVQLKDIRIPEPRAKKIVKSIPEDKTKLKIVYRLRNSSLIEELASEEIRAFKVPFSLICLTNALVSIPFIPITFSNSNHFSKVSVVLQLLVLFDV